MLLTSPYGNVQFEDLNKYRNIGLNLSGGIDSAFLLYILAQTLNDDCVIIPITGIDNARPTNLENAQKILEFIDSPLVGEHAVFWYDKGGVKNKMSHHIKYEDKLFDENKISILCHGRSANPPEDIAKKFDLYDMREKNRDVIKGGRKPFGSRGGRLVYIPWKNVDKRFMAHQYKKFDLMDTLFPLAASCIAYADSTNWFTEPCRHCWWCKEKFWAFGCYDGGVK